MTPTTRRSEAEEILRLYRLAPGTRGHVRAADRRLAERLARQGTLPADVRAAILLAVARRTFRDPHLGPLNPIASLHYFLPVLQEIQNDPLDPDYVEHLQDRLANAITDPRKA